MILKSLCAGARTVQLCSSITNADAGYHDPAHIDINVRVIIGELPAHASVSVDHGSVSARLESQHDFTVKSSRSPISPSDNLGDKTPSIN